VFTTNHVEDIPQGVMRPGRLDAVIHVGALEPEALQRLVEVLIPAERRAKIDYTHVGKAFTDFLPAFAAEAILGALRAHIARNNGKAGKITTDDLVNSAIGLRRQLDLMLGAAEGVQAPTIDVLLTEKIADIVNHTKVGYNGDDEVLRFDPKCRSRSDRRGPVADTVSVAMSATGFTLAESPARAGISPHHGRPHMRTGWFKSSFSGGSDEQLRRGQARRPPRRGPTQQAAGRPHDHLHGRRVDGVPERGARGRIRPPVAFRRFS